MNKVIRASAMMEDCLFDRSDIDALRGQHNMLCIPSRSSAMRNGSMVTIDDFR
jgi:hypothetical protein